MTSRPMQSLRRLRRLLCPFLLAWQAAGCHSWVAVPDVEPTAYIEMEQPEYVRVQIAETHGRGKLQIKNAEVQADSVRGRLLAVRDNWIWRKGGVPIEAILPPLEVRRFSLNRTVWAMMGTAAVVIVPLFISLATADFCCSN